MQFLKNKYVWVAAAVIVAAYAESRYKLFSGAWAKAKTMASTNPAKAAVK